MFKRKDGLWQEKFQTKEMAKPKYFYSSEKTEKKARQDINEQIYNFTVADHHNKHNFKILCEKALEEKERQVSFKTMESYNIAFNRLTSLFEYDIENIEPLMIENIFNSLSALNYSYSYIHKIKIFLSIVFNYAIRQNIKINNFMRTISVPKNAHKGKIKSPDNEIIDLIKEKSLDFHFGLWSLFILGTGTRKGEANAVQKKDIDFINKSISITKSTEFQNNKSVLKLPKTENGIRTVPLLQILEEPLKKHCEKLKPDDFIFGGKEPLTNTAIRYNFDKFRKQSGCDFNIHQLRHAYAKLLYLAGIDPKTAQGLLGHSDIKITMDIYTDFDLTMNKIAESKLNTFLAK